MKRRGFLASLFALPAAVMAAKDAPAAKVVAPEVLAVPKSPPTQHYSSVSCLACMTAFVVLGQWNDEDNGESPHFTKTYEWK